ncbi:MAG: hypothetical protein FJY88_12075 [Candidatus Eisenbacteria bacterium]|nr:hypothetical protein [Candidatus Eisenbacteria bacterium]
MMNQTTTPSTSRPARPKGRTKPAPSGSVPARRTAAVILEVLAGVRSPREAARAISVSANRYYQLEERALDAMVAACEPRPRGRANSPAKEVDRLKRQVKKLQGDVLRHQALARAAQRTVGLVAPAKAEAKPAGTKRRRRKPVVRALKLAGRLQSAASSEPAPAAAGEA